MTRRQVDARPRRVEVVRDTCQPGNTELGEGLRVDAAFDEADSALARTVAVHRDDSPRRER